MRYGGWPKGEWRRWFAWHPVAIEGTLVWLEWVEAMPEMVWCYVEWNYRFPKGKP